MRTAATRLKDFPLEERLAACGRRIASDPSEWKGRWASYFSECSATSAAASSESTGEGMAAGAAALSGAAGEPSAKGVTVLSEPSAKPSRKAKTYERVILDLGCGKGEYTVAVAKLHPEILFVGIDIDGVCVVRSADLANAEGVDNVVFIYERDPELSSIFAEGELAGILMNFPTPYPNKKRAPLRLTYVDRLLEDRHLLVDGGFIRLRTDGQPLRDFSLTQFELAGYELLWTSDDVRSKYPDEPWSGYEHKLTAKGAKVCGCMAVSRAGDIPAAEDVAQTAPLSLVSYLPDDLEHMGYVPYGMEGCVTNLINYRAHLRKKGLPVYTPPKV